MEVLRSADSKKVSTSGNWREVAVSPVLALHVKPGQVEWSGELLALGRSAPQAMVEARLLRWGSSNG